MSFGFFRSHTRTVPLITAGLLATVAVGTGAESAAATSKPWTTLTVTTVQTAQVMANTRVPKAITPESFGAKGDGVADDTVALQRLFSGVPAGARIYLASGKVYRHRDVVRITVPGVTVYGGGALYATQQARSSLWVDADRVALNDIVLTGAKPTQRWYAYEQHRLRIKDRTGVSVTGVKVINAAGAGIFLENAGAFTLTDVAVTDSMADGIHMTGGSHDGIVTRPMIQGAGDDGVAVVSYSSDAGTVQRITVASPIVRNQRWGRGISVVGGRDITYSDITVEGSAGAAVYIANEDAPYFTQDVVNVQVRGGKILQANRNTSIGHGAVLLYAGRAKHSLTGVKVSDVSINQTSTVSGREVGLICEGGTQTGVQIQNLTLDASTNTPFVNTCGAAMITNVSVGGRRLM